MIENIWKVLKNTEINHISKRGNITNTAVMIMMMKEIIIHMIIDSVRLLIINMVTSSIMINNIAVSFQKHILNQEKVISYYKT